MLRADSYTLQYEVTVDTAETGFEYNADYPANGTTTLTYTDGEGNPGSNAIDVPDVYAPKAKPTVPVTPVVPGTTTSVTVNKAWADDEGVDRPESVSVQLYADGVAYGAPVTVSGDYGWSYTWYDLPLGAEYTVAEVNVPEGYEAKVDGYTITNTYVGEEVIEEVEPPLADAPEGELPEEEFDEEDVPMADVPETGDMTAAFAVLSAVSAAGLFVLNKKGKDEE